MPTSLHASSTSDWQQTWILQPRHRVVASYAKLASMLPCKQPMIRGHDLPQPAVPDRLGCLTYPRNRVEAGGNQGVPRRTVPATIGSVLGWISQCVHFFCFWQDMRHTQFHSTSFARIF